MIYESDEIIDEIRRYREAHAAAFDFDPRKIVADLQRQEKESAKSRVIRPAPESKQLQDA